jgi:hypothetical protein
MVDLHMVSGQQYCSVFDYFVSCFQEARRLANVIFKINADVVQQTTWRYLRIKGPPRMGIFEKAPQTKDFLMNTISAQHTLRQERKYK